jgi:hypothetical protein
MPDNAPTAAEHQRVAAAAHIGPDPSGVDQNTSDAARRQIDRGASHHHIHRRLGAAIGNGAARRIVGERAHATRDGDHQPSLTAGNVIAKGLEHRQGPHRVHIQYMGPGFVVDIAPCVLRQASELACGVRAAARSKHAPSVSHVLTKFEAKPTTAAAIECCPSL